MKDGAGGAVQEVAVVADDDDRVRIALEIAFEPERALEVEIVRRLVEEEHVGLEEEHGRERDAHAPAARELAAGAPLGRRVEAEAGENASRSRRGCMGADVRQAQVDVGDTMRVVGGLGFGEQSATLAVSRQHPVDQALIAAGGLLGDAADAGVAGHADGAVVGMELAADQLEQRRLAGAVAADEPDLVTRRVSRR